MLIPFQLLDFSYIVYILRFLHISSHYYHLTSGRVNVFLPGQCLI